MEGSVAVVVAVEEEVSERARRWKWKMFRDRGIGVDSWCQSFRIPQEILLLLSKISIDCLEACTCFKLERPQ